MNILAVDTSCQALVTAVKTDSYYDESENTVQGMQHSQLLMNNIIEMCSHAVIKAEDLDLMICTRGPGSFTGLRIGMATLKGLAMGSSKPIVSVSTLEAHAATVDHFDGAVIPVIDAKKQRWYLAAFECKEGKRSRILKDTDGTEADLAETASKYSKVLLVGPDAQAFLPLLMKAYPKLEIATHVMPDRTLSQSLIDLGIEQFRAKGADDIGQGPVYIRKSDAEIALEEKERNL